MKTSPRSQTGFPAVLSFVSCGTSLRSASSSKSLGRSRQSCGARPLGSTQAPVAASGDSDFVNILSSLCYLKSMQDKTVIALCFTTLVASVGYNLVAVRSDHSTPKPTPQASSSSPSVAVEECLDCVEAVPDSCDLDFNKCEEVQDCTAWLSCTEDCIVTNSATDCYDDCDAAHSDAHSECQSLKSCVCDVCVGQCVDMCTADG